MAEKIYTQKEIAEELGVSRATIDRVIHNRGGISEETTRKVEGFLKEVGYSADVIGRTLAKREKHIIYAVTSMENQFTEDVLTGMNVALGEFAHYGFNIRFLITHCDTGTQQRYLEQAFSNDISGVLLIAFEPDKMKDAINNCVKRGVPVITLNNDAPSSMRMCYVGGDYIEGGMLAGEVMAKLVPSGTVLFINAKKQFWQDMLRIEGFARGIRLNTNIVFNRTEASFNDYHTAYEEIKRLLEEIPDISGIMTFLDDEYLKGFCDSIKSFAKKKITLLTFDMSDMKGQYLRDGYLSAVICQDPFSQGYCSAKLMFRHLLANEPPERVLYTIRYEAVFACNHKNYGKEAYKILK